MQTANDCLVCFLRQALATVRRSTDDRELHWRITTEVGGMLADFETALTAFLERHARFSFVKRSERSTLAHLTQAAWDVELFAEDADHLPESHEECAALDARTLRHASSTVSAGLSESSSFPIFSA